MCCKLLFVTKERVDLSSSTLASNIRIYIISIGRYALTHLKKAAVAFITIHRLERSKVLTFLLFQLKLPTFLPR